MRRLKLSPLMSCSTETEVLLKLYCAQKIIENVLYRLCAEKLRTIANSESSEAFELIRVYLIYVFLISPKIQPLCTLSEKRRVLYFACHLPLFPSLLSLFRKQWANLDKSSLAPLLLLLFFHVRSPKWREMLGNVFNKYFLARQEIRNTDRNNFKFLKKSWQLA
jgi:hypothetical protein